MKRKTENYIIVGLSALCMGFLIYLGSTWGNKWKVDATQERLYTLSDGTKSILNKLNTPLTFKLYYSKTSANKGTEGLRAFNNYFGYVSDLLKEYVSNSRNNISLQIIDPRPDTKDEEDAIAYGLKKFQLTETEKYFFGLVVENQAGAEKIIEFFDPNQQENLEYDLTKLVYSVVNPRKKKVGVISSLPVVNDNMSPYMAQMMRMQGKQVQDSWIITKLMKEFYEVKQIKEGETEIKGIDILLVIHPKSLPDKTLWAIDQFVLKGGNLLLMVDPLSVVDQASNRGGGMFGGASKTDSNLKKLMDKWGVELEEKKFAGDKYLAGVGRTNPNLPPSRLLALLQCNEKCGAPYKETLSYQLSNLTFLYPGSLKIKESNDPNYKATPFLSTTEKGNTYEAARYELSNPQALIRKFKEGSSPIHLGVKVVGKFQSAFPSGVTYKEKVKKPEGVDKKAEKKGKEEEKEVKLTGLTESQKEAAIVVLSDVDWIHDQFAFKETIFGLGATNDNSTLLLNSLELLSGSKELMSVRSKGKFNRSFVKIDKIEFEAEKKTEDKVSEINSSIERFQGELDQLGRQANAGNIGLIQSKGIQKKKELSKKIAQLKGELRDVKRTGREKVEKIGKNLQYFNTLLVPSFIFLFGLFYENRRRKQFHGA